MHINIILFTSLLSTSAIGLVIPADDILEARNPQASTSKGAGSSKGAKGPSNSGNTPKGTKPPTGPFVLTDEHRNKANERYQNTDNLPPKGSYYHINGGAEGPAVKFTGTQVHDAVAQAHLDSYKPVSQQRDLGYRKFGNRDHAYALNPNEPTPFPKQPNRINEARITTELDRKGKAALGPDGQPKVGPSRVQLTKKKDEHGNDVDHLLGVTSHVRDLPPGLHGQRPFGTGAKDDHHTAPAYVPSRDTYQHQPGIHGGLRPAFDDKGKNFNRLPPIRPVGYTQGNPTSGPDMGSSSQNTHSNPLPPRKYSSAQLDPKPLTPTSPSDSRGEGSKGKYETRGVINQGGNKYQVNPGQGSTGQGGSSSSKGKSGSSKGKRG